ncbi:MAG: hypothetical protein ACK4QP_17900 [Pseudorhizobium sp.]
MRSVAQRALAWRLFAALLAVALVFSAPVTHAVPQTCMDGHHQVVDEDADDAASKACHSSGQNCCSVICVFFIAVEAQPTELVQSVLLLSRVMDITDNVAGRDPSPGFEPPRTMG